MLKEETPGVATLKEETPGVATLKEETPDVATLKEETPGVATLKEETPGVATLKEETPDLKLKETLVDRDNRINVDRSPSLLVNIPEGQQVVFHQDMLPTTRPIEAVYLGNEDRTIGNNWSQCTAHTPHRAVFFNKTNGRALVPQGRKQIANITHSQRECLNLVCP